MSKLTRAVQKVFADSAAENEIEQIGSQRSGSVVYSKDPVVLQALAAYLGGLMDCVSSDKYIPALEDINAIYFLFSRQLAYLYQEGIPEWDAATTYYANGLVKDPAGTDVYYSKIADNLNNALTDTDSWGLYFSSAGLVPIGTIIPFYDFNAALTFDTDHWAYCNGQSKTINGTLQTLPDLSNRYLVGFGTEAGADIGSAAWATAAVGNSGHTINIAHTHTAPIHTHSISLTSWAGSAHSHSASGLYIPISPGDEYTFFNASAATAGSYTANRRSAAGTVTSNPGAAGFAVLGATATESAHAHQVSGTSANGGASATSSTLSSTQSIQPRSVRVRYLMRVA